MHVMQTSIRRARIKALIVANPIVTQEELCGTLHREGIDVTQSTLSRDLTELRVVKRKGAYVFLDQPRTRLAQLGFISANPAGANLVVLKTDIGSAQRVAVMLDSSGLEGVVGTLAGDDTIFLAVTGPSTQKKILEALERGL